MWPRAARRRRSIRPPSAAAPPGQAQRGERRGEHDVLAAPLEVTPIVEGAGLGHRKSLDLGRRQPQTRAFDQRPERREGRRRRRAEVERERRALGDGGAVDRGDLDVEREALAADLGQRQRGRLQGHRVADEARQTAVRLRVEPGRTDHEPGDRDRRQQAEESRAAQTPAPHRRRPRQRPGRWRPPGATRPGSRAAQASAQSATTPTRPRAAPWDGRKASAATRPPT